MEEFVAKKSAWSCITFGWIISCILIIPIFILIIRILCVKAEKITFYSDRVVWEQGLLNKRTKKFAFTGIFSVNVEIPFMGKILNYGHIRADFVGKCDINTFYIKNPNKLVDYLENKIVKKADTNIHMI